jgi:DNA modification methylase
MSEPYYADEQVTLWHGDALAVLRTLPDASVDCCVTSPPYFGLRDYGEAGQYGLEASPAEYVETMCAVFAEVRRVLADDGTVWLNLGDSFVSKPPGNVRGVSDATGLHGGRTSDATWANSLGFDLALTRVTSPGGSDA